MNPRTYPPQEIRSCLAACIQRFCQVFWGPYKGVGEELVRQILDGTFLQPFEAALPFMGQTSGTDLKRLRNLLDPFTDGEELFSSLEEGYVRLFINDRGGVTAPLYASCYQSRDNPQLMEEPARRMQQVLAELEIHVRDDLREPPDHLAIQLEVLYFLLSSGDTSHTGKTTPHDAGHFAAGHLIPWVPRFRKRLEDETRCPFYPLIASLLCDVLEAIPILKI